MNNNKQLSNTFLKWLPLAAGIVIMGGLVYAAVQQNYRSNANDPQIQIAQDISTAIIQGTPAESIVPPVPTADMTQSLSPFVAIYNATGTPVGSSVGLDGKLPTLPSGVFDYVKVHGQEILTWQPKSGVRIAAVVMQYKGQESGFILAGRSLTEVEKRIDNLAKMTAAAVALALLITFLLFWFTDKMSRDTKETEHVHVEIDADVEKTDETKKLI